jgi:hypothetical protein
MLHPSGDDAYFVALGRVLQEGAERKRALTRAEARVTHARLEGANAAPHHKPQNAMPTFQMTRARDHRYEALALVLGYIAGTEGKLSRRQIQDDAQNGWRKQAPSCAATTELCGGAKRTLPTGQVVSATVRQMHLPYRRFGEGVGAGSMLCRQPLIALMLAMIVERLSLRLASPPMKFQT